MNEALGVISPQAWTEYAALQKKAHRINKLDSYAWAIEDQIDNFLDSIQKFCPETAESRAKSSHNLLLNRRKKHNWHSRLLEQESRREPPQLSAEIIAIDAIDSKRKIAAIDANTSPTERRILWQLADGINYATLAATENLTISALKSKACRCRQRLKSLAA